MGVLFRLIGVLIPLLLVAPAYAACKQAKDACAVAEANLGDIPLQGPKYRWALGMDVSDQIMHMANDFQYIAFNYRHGMALYAAYRFMSPLGFELGYHWTTDKQKNIITVPGTQLFGATATTVAEYQCKLRVENYYLDGYWHYKVKKIAEVKVGGGIGFQRQNMRFYSPQGSTDPVAIALVNLGTGTTLTARFNLGLQTMFTQRWGGRVLFGYETTNTITARDVLANSNPHMFDNSYTISLGVFFTLTGKYNESSDPRLLD